MPYPLAAAVTLLSALLYAATIVMVGRARWRYGIKAPAIAGHPAFERLHRVQANTLEQMPVFLPALWLAAITVSDALAAALGALFVAFRILYAVLYLRAAEARGYGYGPAALCMLALWGVAAWGVGRQLLT
ncbi:MAG: MAPEG family protein [Reyranellaceae bacterium]